MLQRIRGEYRIQRGGLNPFFFRGMLQQWCHLPWVAAAVLIPFSSGECCSPDIPEDVIRHIRLNPFFFRGMLQPSTGLDTAGESIVLIPFSSGECCSVSYVSLGDFFGLNPFFFRGMLQLIWRWYKEGYAVLIPFSSGECCSFI